LSVRFGEALCLVADVEARITLAASGWSRRAHSTRAGDKQVHLLVTSACRAQAS